jgi:hypothetical protein
MSRATNGVSLPVTRALGNGETGDNAGLSEREKFVPTNPELTGPSVDEKTGAFLPAAYEVLPGIVRIDR